MIKDTELRLGNWVTAPAFELPFQVDMNALIRAIDLEPISLTEEWLLKLGFKKELGVSIGIQSVGAKKHKYDKFSIDKFVINNSDIDSKYFEFTAYSGLKTKVLYVHQLQNLYFSLTSHELKIT